AKDVRRPRGAGAERRPGEGGTRVPAQGHGKAEVVAAHPIGGVQLLLLAPTASAAREYIGRPGAAVRAVGPDERHAPIAAQRHGAAEGVTAHPIAGGELLLWAPTAPAACKHVGRPGAVVRAVGSDERRAPVAAERHGPPEEVAGCPVA